ncbi:phosphotransferase [Pseudonocardia sp. TRM90224]|uniref:phosphotransferase n=1 Tax=Pseudonocardia sp. TRM90224 TaxID=2812678 RepID=UPI001E5B3260|nr:phosphotransferase [Pseudonocardia sp. TRM90224]
MEESLPGGRTTGAVRVADTIRKPAQPWSAAVRAVLGHLEATGFEGAPRDRGLDEHGRSILTFLPGRTVGEDLPWPAWVHSDAALTQVGRWLRRLHDATADFVPPADAVWLSGRPWRPGLVIGHQDVAPYNAVFDDDGLIGFVDWDTAAPSSRELDLAFAALMWVPLHIREVVEPQGFRAFDDRSRRLHVLLDAYGYDGDRAGFGAAVAERCRINVAAIRRMAAGGEAIYQALLQHADQLERAAVEIEELPAGFWATEISSGGAP